MARASYREIIIIKKECVQIFPLLLLCLSIWLFENSGRWSVGFSPFSKTPPLIFRTPPRVSVIMFQLSPIHPPFVIIPLILLFIFFFSSWTPATLQTRAPKHTRVAYSNRLFWEKHEPRLALVGPSSVGPHSIIPPKIWAAHLFVQRADPLKLIRTSDTKMQIKNGNNLSQGSSPQNKSS